MMSSRGAHRALRPLRATILFGMGGLVAVGACEGPQTEYPFCISPSEGCYQSHNPDCDRMASEEVPSCDGARQFLVCSATPTGCSCSSRWALDQPPTIDCDRVAVGQPSVCCAQPGYPGTTICSCTSGAPGCSGLVVEDCVEAGTP